MGEKKNCPTARVLRSAYVLIDIVLVCIILYLYTYTAVSAVIRADEKGVNATGDWPEGGLFEGGILCGTKGLKADSRPWEGGWRMRARGPHAYAWPQ